uniref:Putative secreted protein n=1 Tax=Ixodes ricinus TaxID=34613 RepID=A0A147BKF3_IXORI
MFRERLILKIPLFLIKNIPCLRSVFVSSIVYDFTWATLVPVRMSKVENRSTQFRCAKCTSRSTRKVGW